jgi:hypothetical protein
LGEKAKSLIPPYAAFVLVWRSATQHTLRLGLPFAFFVCFVFFVVPFAVFLPQGRICQPGTPNPKPTQVVKNIPLHFV